ncbi:hypothetical protein GCM10009527_097000 [Actinomadura nitritigenes]|uniref:Uncharacterized protein n=1 Tax=Actinomadura nitritigenes TaxID=134602 RepID=A0ABS3RGH2_9ACTN|nr:hypothetical protein [Actinomadura nitritigenes]MBO2445323.1 hypothetical protein [Actinomadura nitritigenes]
MVEIAVHHDGFDPLAHQPDETACDRGEMRAWTYHIALSGEPARVVGWPVEARARQHPGLVHQVVELGLDPAVPTDRVDGTLGAGPPRRSTALPVAREYVRAGRGRLQAIEGSRHANDQCSQSGGSGGKVMGSRCSSASAAPDAGMMRLETALVELRMEVGATIGAVFLLPPEERVLRLAVHCGASWQIAAP